MNHTNDNYRVKKQSTTTYTCLLHTKDQWNDPKSKDMDHITVYIKGERRIVGD